MPHISLPTLSIPSPFRHIAMGLWIVLTCAVIVLSLMPNGGPTGELHLDKVLHLGAYGVLAGLPALAFHAPRIVFGAALAMAPLWLGLEFAQGFVPNRQADGLDMVANLIGVIIGIGLGPLLRTFANRILSSPTTGAD